MTSEEPEASSVVGFSGDLPLDMLRAENLVTAAESALTNGELEFVKENLCALQALTDRTQRLMFDLSRLQYRACLVREAYESAKH